MDYLTEVDNERLEKLWKDLDGDSLSQDFSEGLLQELFENQAKSLKDSINLVSDSIAKRKKISQTNSALAKSRLDSIRIALKGFPEGTMYPHHEARRTHLEREIDQLIHDMREEEVAACKDLHELYNGMIYLVYKQSTFEKVKRAVS